MEDFVESFLKAMDGLRGEVTVDTIVDQREHFINICTSLEKRGYYKGDGDFYKKEFAMIEESVDIEDEIKDRFYLFVEALVSSSNPSQTIYVLSRSAPVILFCIEEVRSRRIGSNLVPMINFGKHKGKKADEVPLKWLKWWYKNANKTKNYWHKSANRDLHEWIEANVDDL